MDTNILSSACFSGYRPEKFTFPLHDSNHDFIKLQKGIYNAIFQALGHGYNTFFCGMSKGFDLLCGDILLDIREQQKEYYNVRLVAVLPYASHTFSDRWGKLHDIVMQCANQVILVSPEYIQNCYNLRNRYLVKHSSHLICYWDGQAGGTAQTFGLSKEKGHSIHNVADFIPIL